MEKLMKVTHQVGIWEALIWSTKGYCIYSKYVNCCRNMNTCPKSGYLMLLTRVHAWGPLKQLVTS